MQNRRSSILCLHQGTELYGSDRSFLTAVQALKDSGATIDVILPGDGVLADELRKFKGINLFFYRKGILRKRDLRRPFSFLFNTLSGLFFYARLFKYYPVIYINTAVMFSALLAAFVFRFSSRRIICHVREIPTGIQVKLFRLLLKMSGAELVFNSYATQEAFGLPGVVVYNGVDPVKEQVLEQSSGASFLKILLIGRINHWKGQSLFIDTVAALSREAQTKFKIRIVGSPFEGNEFLRDKLESQIVEFGLVDVVEIVPFCHDPAEHYMWADYVVVPSTRPEPFGRVAIEAFAFGKPVIAARHGGLVEIVENEKNGFLFSPGDKAELGKVLMAILDTDTVRYRELSINARSSFERRFSISCYQSKIRALVLNE